MGKIQGSILVALRPRNAKDWQKSPAFMQKIVALDRPLLLKTGKIREKGFFWCRKTVALSRSITADWDKSTRTQ